MATPVLSKETSSRLLRAQLVERCAVKAPTHWGVAVGLALTGLAIVGGVIASL
jgi:hypothetical protein